MIGGSGTSDVLKYVPPALVSGTTLFGISWANWVYILTALWTLLQIGDWAYTKFKLWRARREHTQ